jgi:prevent-host-death family protein
MPEDTVSIGQVKRDISDLVNRVAYRGDRILLTSRGKPKAALVSMADYERLKRQESDPQLAYWNQWLLRAEDLSRTIRERRHGEYVALEALEQDEESDLEQRDDDHLAE